ncbi:MAG: response regulator transcription factor [Flavobacterium sp.]|nr:response regulator transcription factor [Candidatus Neoflavobacterium equi]
MKILVIEDEVALSDIIKKTLTAEHYIVETADRLSKAMDKIATYDYDCILLDINLPDGNGLDLLKEIKRMKKSESVLIISARNSVDDKVAGLDLGADDYLAKPFELIELHARVKSIIRRKYSDGIQFITYQNIQLNPENREITINNKQVTLNRKEFDLLHYFLVRPEKLVQKTAIAEAIWGDFADQSDSLDFIYSQIKNLRKKLKTAEATCDIQAVYGIGYKLI